MFPPLRKSLWPTVTKRDTMTNRTWAKLTEPDKAVLLRHNPGVQVKVARTLGVSAGQVSRVFWGKTTSARILTQILKAVKS